MWIAEEPKLEKRSDKEKDIEFQNQIHGPFSSYCVWLNEYKLTLSFNPFSNILEEGGYIGTSEIENTNKFIIWKQKGISTTN